MEHGITRIVITDEIKGRGKGRFESSKKGQPAANKLYRKIFEELGMPLAPGDEDKRVTLAEFEAGYDRFLGIDVILTFADGEEATLQEKFLEKDYRTVTVEYMQNPITQEKGDWFKMKCDYYFVGYDRIEGRYFQDWIMLHWSHARQLTAQGRITWDLLSNKRDGARANFRSAHFSTFPPECVVAAEWTEDDLLYVLPEQRRKQYEQPGALHRASVSLAWLSSQSPVAPGRRPAQAPPIQFGFGWG